MLLKLKLRVYEGLNHIRVTYGKQKCKLQFLKVKKKIGSWHFDEEQVLEAPAMRQSHVSLYMSMCP